MLQKERCIYLALVIEKLKTFDFSDGMKDFDITADSLSIYNGYNTTADQMVMEILNPGLISDFNLWDHILSGLILKLKPINIR